MLKYTMNLAELKLLTHFNNHLPIVWVQYQEHQRRGRDSPPDRLRLPVGQGTHNTNEALYLKTFYLLPISSISPALSLLNDCQLPPRKVTYMEDNVLWT